MTARPAIFIIESVGQQDVEAARCEGRALKEALQLAGHETLYWDVKNPTELKRAFLEVQKHLGPFDYEAKVVPFFHISAHGDAEGIGLTSGEVVSWTELAAFLWEVGESTGRVKDGMALAHITMSSCKGMNGIKMWCKDQFPAVSLIGPAHDVDWVDALTAWIVFYHLVLTKDANPIECLPIVNSAAGIDGFDFFGPTRKV